MLLADTLSRAYLQDTSKSQTECVNMVDYVPVSTESMEKIHLGTRADQKLQTLIKTLQKGWPQCKKAVPDETTQFHSLQDELVFKGERVVIPDSLQANVIQRIHPSRIGEEGCLKRVRYCVLWHGMNDHIKKYISKCDICQSVDTNQQKETLQPHEPTNRPWAKVGTNLLSFEGKDYLITVAFVGELVDGL